MVPVVMRATAEKVMPTELARTPAQPAKKRRIYSNAPVISYVAALGGDRNDHNHHDNDCRGYDYDDDCGTNNYNDIINQHDNYDISNPHMQ
jgi:hypothetical protein